MKVLFYEQFFYTEDNPHYHLNKDIIEEIIKNNIKIHRFIVKDPEGKVKDFFEPFDDKIEFSYDTFIKKIVKRENLISRIFNEYFIVIKMGIRTLFLKDFDCILAYTPYTAIIPAIIGRIKKKKMIFILQDVWPDNAVAVNKIKKNGLIYFISNLIQNAAYKLSSHIITNSQDIKELLISKGVNSNKISLAYNWALEESPCLIQRRDNLFIKKYSLEMDKFYVIYSGNIANAHNIEIILNAASMLVHNKDIEFIIVGEGPAKNDMLKNADQLSLKNINFLPFQDRSAVAHTYSAASVNIIPVKKGGIRTLMPGKTAVALSSGKPVIVCAEKDSKFAELITSYKAGFVVDPDDPQELAKVISDMASNEEIFTIRTEDVLKCYSEIFIRSINVAKYCDIIKGVIRNEL